MANKNSILDKVNFLLSTAKNGKCTNEELKEIVDLVPEHTSGMVLGRVFGYSVSDFAIATLKWLGKDKEYEQAMSGLQEERNADIKELISKKLYLEY